MKCILGCLDTEDGLKICEEMLDWLKPNYDVVVVHQEASGTKFEYPFIKTALNISTELDEPVLYLHTKGAANKVPLNYKVSMMAPFVNYPNTAIPEDCQKIVRNLWKLEFTTDRAKLYLDALSKNKLSVACPFTGIEKYTWQNGFMISSSAAAELNKTFHLDANRHYYETMFKNTPIKVIGIISNEISDDIRSRTIMWNYIWKNCYKANNNS